MLKSFKLIILTLLLYSCNGSNPPISTDIANLIQLESSQLHNVQSTPTPEPHLWNPIGGPGGGQTQQITVYPLTPQLLYATTPDQGILKTTDRGGSWYTVNHGLPDQNVKALAAPSLLETYAGTFSKGVFKSTDGGVSWTEKNNGLTNLNVHTLASHPLNPDTVYAGTGVGGIFKSTNGGDNWRAVNNGISPQFIQILQIDPTNPTTLYAGTNRSGLYKSNDSGENWIPINNGLANLDVRVIAINPQDTNTLYVGTLEGIFKSTDTSIVSDDRNSTIEDSRAADNLGYKQIMGYLIKISKA